LTGLGTIVGASINAGSELLADQLATGLTVQNKLTFNDGGVYRVVVDANGSNGLTRVVGNVSIGNGTWLEVAPKPGNYSAKTVYTVLTYTGARTGTFTNLDSDFAYLTPTVLYPNGAVQLELDRNDIHYGDVGSSWNQHNVGEALEGIYVQGGNAVTDNLNVMNVSQAQQALKVLAADEIPTYLGVAEQRMNTLYMTVGNRLALASREPQSPTVRQGLWASLQYNGMHTGGQMPQGSPSVTANLGSIAAGYDRALNDQVRIGAAMSIDLGGLQFKDRNASGRSTGAQVLGYGSFEPSASRFYANGMVGIGAWRNQLDRRLNVATLSENPSGSFVTEATGAYAEGGMKLAYRSLDIRPYVAARLNWIRQGGFSENQAPLMGVTAASMSQTNPATLLGVRVARDAGFAKLSWEANVAWQHRYGSTEQLAQLAFNSSPGQNWTVFATPLDRDTAHVDATLRYTVKPKSVAFLRLAADMGAKSAVYSVNLGAQIKY
jgi:uncharacterized protein with beta-barrel porin domain